MKKITTHSKSGLFLMEMIFVLLFLGLTCGVCVRLFAASYMARVHAREDSHIQELITSAGEILEGTDGTVQNFLLLCFPQPDNKSAGSRKTANIFFIVFLLFINICTPIFFSTVMGNSITSGRYMQLLPSFFHIFTKAFLKIFVFFHSAARLFPVFLSFLAESMPYWN